MAQGSITTRISALFACLALLVLASMGYVIHAAVTHHFEEQDRMALQGKLALLQNLLTAPANKERAKHFRDNTLRTKLSDALIGHHELALQISDAQGNIVFSTPHFSLPSSLITQSVDYAPNHPLPLLLVEVEHDHAQYRAVAVTFRAHEDAQVYRVLMGVDVGHHHHFLESFRLQLLGVGGTGLALMIVLGWLLTRHGLTPLREMARVAEGISAQSIQARLPITRLPAELRSLANSFNGMLDRLEEALARLSDFSSDIAHELRTPVSNLMTQTQVLLTKARSAEEYRDGLCSNMEELERLARMIADMLFLAKADNGQIVPHHDRIVLANEVRALFEFYDAVAAEKQVTLLLQGDATLAGDRLMLQRALGNVLSNAIRHARPGTAITVNLSHEESANEQNTHQQSYNQQSLVRIVISNQGETLAPETLARLFERFFRADASRHRIDEGAGLGLAITRSIVMAHGGEILARSHHGVTTFEMVFPAPRSS